MAPEPAEPRAPRARRYEDIRFYVDEDMLGFGYSMMWARTDTVTCGEVLVGAELPRQTPDVEWIPIVAGHGWVAITGNDAIHSSPIEAPVARRAKARIVCLHDSRGQLSTWGKLCQLAQHWQQIENFIADHPEGPWWLSVTRSGIRELDYRV